MAIVKRDCDFGSYPKTDILWSLGRIGSFDQLVILFNEVNQIMERRFFMASIINNNKVAFFLLALVLVGLLTVLAFAVVTHGAGLELTGISTLRYCSLSGSVCTG